MPLSHNDAPNFDPLSVSTRSTANSSLAMTSSMKAMAVFGRSGEARSTRSRVQSSMAVNW